MPRHKGILSTLLCCFRPTPTSPREPEENGQYSPKLQGKYLLPPQRPADSHKMCLVIDLDETLVHSSFKPIQNADFIVPVEIDGTVHQVYVLKRPHVDEFLQKMGQIYECVLFTASLAKYADPVADLLDKWGVFRGRLFRESCVFYRGNYVKDLGKLGRDLHRVVIVDNSPASYIFHPDNAVPVASWFDDMNDNELRELIPFFEKLAKVDNVYSVLRNANNSMHPSINSGIPRNPVLLDQQFPNPSDHQQQEQQQSNQQSSSNPPQFLCSSSSSSSSTTTSPSSSTTTATTTANNTNSSGGECGSNAGAKNFSPTTNQSPQTASLHLGHQSHLHHGHHGQSQLTASSSSITMSNSSASAAALASIITQVPQPASHLSMNGSPSLTPSSSYSNATNQSLANAMVSTPSSS